MNQNERYGERSMGNEELDLIVLHEMYPAGATADVMALIGAIRTARSQRDNAEWRAQNWFTIALCLSVFLIGVVGTASVTMGWWR